MVFTESVHCRRLFVRPFVRRYLHRRQATYIEDLNRALAGRRPPQSRRAPAPEPTGEVRETAYCAPSTMSRTVLASRAVYCPGALAPPTEAKVAAPPRAAPANLVGPPRRPIAMAMTGRS